MFTFKTLTKITILGLALTIGLVGCASTSSDSTIRPPTNYLLANNEGDIDGFFNSWIAPHRNAYGTIGQKDMDQYNSTKKVIVDGFSRYCRVNGWANNHEKFKHDEKYKCTDRNGELIGEIEVSLGNLYTLIPTLNSPKRIKEKEKEYELKRKGLNGPSGELITAKGNFKFSRIGNLNKRHIVDMFCKKNSYLQDPIKIEDVAKIEFSDSTETLFTFRDSTIPPCDGYMKQRIYSGNSTSVHNYGSGSDGMPFVIIDKNSKQPYTRLYPDIEGIQKIIFDEPGNWELKTARKISSTYEAFTDKTLKAHWLEYLDIAVSKTLKVYDKSTVDLLRNVALKTESRTKLVIDLTSHLSEIINESTCNNTTISNDTDQSELIDSMVECKQAEHELKIITDDINSISYLGTPLSMKYALDTWVLSNRDILNAEVRKMEQMEKRRQEAQNQKIHAKNTISKNENIGRKICRDGLLTYNRSQKGPGKIVGFLEGMSPDGFRIQFRVFGWMPSDKNTYYSANNPKFGDFKTEAGLIYWDDVANWYLCN